MSDTDSEADDYPWIDEPIEVPFSPVPFRIEGLEDVDNLDPLDLASQTTTDDIEGGPRAADPASDAAAETDEPATDFNPEQFSAAGMPKLEFPPLSINESLKATAAYALGFVPVAGSTLSFLVSILWPSDTVDNWGQVRRQVEELIHAKINDYVYHTIHQKVLGVRNLIANFLRAIKNNDKEGIRTEFRICRELFVSQAPELRVQEQYEWGTAPLYAIWSQLHISLLREGVMHGRSWGFNQSTLNDIGQDLQTWIQAHGSYLGAVIARRKQRLMRSVPSMDRYYTNVYNYWQSFTFQAVILIHDYCVLLEAQKLRPGTKKPLPFIDVYTRAYGTADHFQREEIEWARGNIGVGAVLSKPLVDITSIYIEREGELPTVVKVSHPNGGGPVLWASYPNARRLNEYPIMSRTGYGRHKNIINLPGSASHGLYRIKGARVRAGSIPLALELVLDRGEVKQIWAGLGGQGQWHDVSVEGRMLTTLNMWARSSYYGQVVSCVLFGFSHDPRRVASKAKRFSFVGDIEEPKKRGEEDEELCQARKDYWRAIDIFAKQRDLEV